MSYSLDDLHLRLGDRDATIGVIGLGYVGLPLALEFTAAGFDVAGFDIDLGRVDRLLHADSYVDDVSDAALQKGLDSGFTPGAEPQVVADCDAYVIAVPTGMNDKTGEPRMDAVEAATETVAEQSGSRKTLVVVSSTVYPGATREVVAPIVEEGRDAPTHLAMVPERLNPGGDVPFEEIPLVVGADTNPAREAAVELFDAVVADTYPVDSTETAELTKTLENTYRMVNIALVNELVTLAEGLEGDVWEAIDAAATKPFGFQSFYPGPGVGGHCIPIDPQFLVWRADQFDGDLAFIRDAHRVNERMPELVVDRLETMLSGRGISPEDATIVALGAAYKPNVGDTRNSPALRVADRLDDRAKVTVVDPHVDDEGTARRLLRSPEEADLAGADAVVLLVDHDAFDLEYVGKTAKFVFDTRNAMPPECDADVVTLGEVTEQSHWKPDLLAR
ncbi:nucleotide sugar dehydrogenase [Halalkaliarchaeum sp. AArc-GB]|uniref:nucleotide sugar dehydrogenase n=1 Tax=Halalkaliarchaeum sp. AArc-GB TaxID=3074078 RepID=UPI002856E3A9|nr:nucleotide sugar dehydrogenase [Halalkaliarchaeum sp. AArc-GB]MDR5674209.1 nucleotide sugar dehydrogenase [Halalkaliarchaeum sp. AArc-GB]